MNEDKLLKDIETKIKNGELKNEKELAEHLTELRYRGILTQMKVNSELERLSKLYGNKTVSKEKNSNKRITRTPQSRYF